MRVVDARKGDLVETAIESLCRSKSEISLSENMYGCTAGLGFGN